MTTNADARIFLIADHHFGDEDIRLYEERPFENTEQMDREMICRWNAVVRERDLVWHLGDFCADGPDRCRDILARLHGRKRLIMGNHDRYLTAAGWRAAGFEECYDLPVLFRGFFLLSHEPLYTCRSMPYANLFGHVHGAPAYTTVSARSACVSAER
ncbi:MAG: metallophosphoesterase, partial [Eubacteriales bacterium]|nr:metallophosphoesterase [Eubacteriales bacterium]